MPLWMHLFEPLIMLSHIVVTLLLNFGLLLIVSSHTEDGLSAKFALCRLTVSFVTSVAALAAGYGVMMYFCVFAESGLQDSLLACDYSSLTVMKVPVFAVLMSAVAGYFLNRFVTLAKTGIDGRMKGILSLCFCIVNLPYLVLIPIAI